MNGGGHTNNGFDRQNSADSADYSQKNGGGPQEFRHPNRKKNSLCKIFTFLIFLKGRATPRAGASGCCK